MNNEETKFNHWCIVELFGHQKIAGYCTEENIAGTNMLRVDVPATKDQQAFSKYYGSGAIYAINPVDETTAKIAAQSIQMAPVVWTDEMISSLKRNFYKKTNKELAKLLGLNLTVTRNKCRELGLKRMTLEYWNKEMVQYLKDNYKTKGDVEIMEYFEVYFPKAKGWRRTAIHQKRKYLGLHRTKDEYKKIISVNVSPGGRSCTIDKNSSSKNMHPKWVAQQLAWRDPEMQHELMKHPEIIEAGRSLIKLKRATKEKLKDAKS